MSDRNHTGRLRSDLILEKTFTLMFTDVEASTSLATRKGDVEARGLLSRHREIIRGELSDHHGREIDSAGDSFLVAFESARQGVRCALAIHTALSAQRKEGPGVRVRIGLNAGDVLCEEEDISGSAISGAARVVAVAGAGEVWVSDVVKQLSYPIPGATFIDRGPRDLRGFDHPVRFFEVKEERSLSIIIAEDNRLVREGVASMLGLYGDMRVIGTCSDLASTQSAIDDRVPDVVITDMRMPPTGTDEGLRLAEWLELNHPGVAVVILSQYVDHVYVRRLLGSGLKSRAFLLKESVSETDVLRHAIKTVASGGVYLDPEVDAVK